jgi:hypothetical protein
MTMNAYDSKPAIDDQVHNTSATEALWNPNATANWSLVFSPAFGSYLQMLNWRTLGRSDLAESSQNWFYASLLMLVVYVLLGALISDPKTAEGAIRGLSFLYLLGWYFSDGRSQGKFVKETFGSRYPRKPWGKALLIAVAILIGYFFCFTVLELIAAAIRHS